MATSSEIKIEGAELSSLRSNKLNLSRAILKKSNLVDSKITNSYLSRIDLSDSFLNHADFSNSDLEESIFKNANLSFANLENTRLSGSDFTNAQMDYVNLKKSISSWREYTATEEMYEVNEVNFENANFYGAMLENANLGGTNLCGVNLDEISFNEQTNFSRAKYNILTNFPNGFNPEKYKMEKDKDFEETQNQIIVKIGNGVFRFDDQFEILSELKSFDYSYQFINFLKTMKNLGLIYSIKIKTEDNIKNKWKLTKNGLKLYTKLINK